jgi:hypothetical protein
MTGWTKTSGSSDQAADPLAGFAGKPILAAQSAGATYLGRVVIEVWDTGRSHDPSFGLTFSSDAVDGNHRNLLRHVANGLPTRVAKLP